MKQVLLLVLAGLPLALPSAQITKPRSGAFEGMIEYSAVDAGPDTRPAFARMYLSGTRSRWEYGFADGFASLSDAEARTAALVMDDLHLYIDLSLTEEEDKKDLKAPKFKVERTGKTEDILGYHCDELVVEREGSEGNKFHIWLAEALTAETFQGNRQDTRYAKEFITAFKRALGREKPGLMLRWQFYEGGGLKTVQASKIEKVKLRDSQVQVPEGYSRTTWAALALGAAKVRKAAEEAGEEPEFIGVADCLKESAKETGKKAVKNMLFKSLGF